MKSLLQTQEWASLKEQQGWSVHWVDEILILEKKLPLGLSFLYAPEVDFFKINFQIFLPKIKEIIQKSHSLFLRLDFINQKNSVFGEKITKILENQKFIKSFEEIQPEYRQIIDITKSEEQILAKMKPKGRYNIRVAEKYKVSSIKYQVSEIKTGIDIFYKIFMETAKRDGFEIRPKKYFIDLLRILQKDGLAELLVIRYNKPHSDASQCVPNGQVCFQTGSQPVENEIPVAAGIITFFTDTATYLYGASLSEYRNVMAPYLMHWEAIKEAKRRGCHYYDLLAVAPFGPRYKIQDTRYKHKYEGITRFKEQFGGIKYQTVGSWDLVYKPIWYTLFKIIEQIRRH